MNKPRARSTSIADIESVADALTGFDFRVDPEDFIVYELGRMIEEDRATFEDEEFRRLIDEGIRQHVEENTASRAQLAALLGDGLMRLDPGARAIAERVVRALQDPSADLRGAAVIVRAYTAYLFDLLDKIPDSSSQEEAAREWIDRWRNGRVSPEVLISELHRVGRPAVGPAADLLFDSFDDSAPPDAALAVLAGIHSPASARVLAHVVSEPMLSEDLETKALAALRNTWILAKPYVLHNLRNHSHEDLPYRWFQLLVESKEPAAVDLILEEIRVHGANPMYREDLVALVDLLRGCEDPEVEDKILGFVNAPEAPAAVTRLLEDFFRRKDR